MAGRAAGRVCTARSAREGGGRGEGRQLVPGSGVARLGGGRGERGGVPPGLFVCRNLRQAGVKLNESPGAAGAINLRPAPPLAHRLFGLLMGMFA